LLQPLAKTVKQTYLGIQQLSQSSKYLEKPESISLYIIALHFYDYKAQFQYQFVYDDVDKLLNEIVNLKLFSPSCYIDIASRIGILWYQCRKYLIQKRL